MRIHQNIQIKIIMAHLQSKKRYHYNNYNKIMQTFQLDPNILNNIFHHQNISEQVIKQLTDWQHSLDPSSNLLKSILSQYFLNNQEALVLTAKRIDFILISLQDKKCSKTFLRALLGVIKSNQQKLKQFMNYEIMASKWSTINIDILQFFFQAFNIWIDVPKNSQKEPLIKIPLQEAVNKIKLLTESKDYDNAMNLIKLIGYPQNQTKMLLQKMANSKDASKAANLIKSHKIDSKLVPQVGERLNKNMVRHFYKTSGWEGAQQIFFDNPEALACLVEDLVYKNKKKEAISISWRHPQILKYVTKQQCLQVLQSQKIKQNEANIEQYIIKNSLFNDYFGPSNLQTYLSLHQFGINRQSVIWVESKSPQMQLLSNYIRSADFFAIDTESLVGKTKLERKKLQPASVIQIAFKDKIFIVDGHNCKDQHLREAIVQYAKSDKPLLGHAISNDIDTMLCSLGFDESQIKLVRFNRIVDTCQLFKAIFTDQKYSNLAHICKIVLKKEICKSQTLTNWGRRPLRQNQLHYAAMDAYCVIKIFQGLRQEVGENMLNYFLDQDI